jgi:hypothetical protein
MRSPWPRRGARPRARLLTRDWRGLVTLLAVLALVVVLLALPFGGPREAQLSAYGDSWDDVSDFRADLEGRTDRPFEVRTLSSSACALSSIEDATGHLYLVIGVERDYTTAEWRAVRGFIDRGGAVVVADDYGSGNSLLRGGSELLGMPFPLAGAGPPLVFSGERLADVRVERNPLLVRVSVPVPGGRELQLLLNDPSCLIENEDYWGDPNAPRQPPAAEGFQVLARSTDRSWMDEDRDGERDPGENSRSFPVVAVEDDIVLISDPSIFINDMYRRQDNREFIMLLLDKLLPVLSATATVIIDEGVHFESRPLGEVDDVVLRPAMGALSPDAPSGLALILLVVLLAAAGLGGSRRPTRFRPHVDRLSERHVVLPGPGTIYADYNEARGVLMQRLRHAYGLDPAELPRLPPQLVSELVGDWNLARFALMPMPPDPATIAFALAAISSWRPPMNADAVLAKVEAHLAAMDAGGAGRVG